jgi:hypothetical protein
MLKIQDNFSDGNSAHDQFWNEASIQKMYKRFRTDAPLWQGIYRSGQFVEKICEIHGLKGVQFGNWLTAEDRYNYLLATHACLFDMNQVLKFKQNSLGLNKSLAVTFGSRGVPNALAHYEGDRLIINLSRYKRSDRLPPELELTKEERFIMTGGVGSFGHEYGHFLDNAFGLHSDQYPGSNWLTTLPRSTSKEKFKYDKKPNQGQGFKTKMKQGTRGVGMGKAKFEYKEGENMDKGKNTTVKKVETKEASRTLGSGSNFRKGGLPKPRAHSKANTAIQKENVDVRELQILREKNNEYRNALNVFRDKLNEVAVFNSNLAYATRLFTEHSTTKQEKINILKRFDGVETLKESKNLYKIVKDELSDVGTKDSNSITESFERTVEKTPTSGSAANLIESKTYENPQYLRMKDLMSKLK